MIIQLLLYLFVISVYSCPNNCSYRGICSNGSLGLCDCYPGFHGVDCSIRLCPAGVAWVDYPSSSEVAHADYTECSNMGKCDRSTGKCICREGFTGPACGQMLCPLGNYPLSDKYTGLLTKLPCSGNGKCTSLKDVSTLQDYIHYFNQTEYNGWDANLIYGCVCDSGWEGFDCSKRSCPYGDDPITYGEDEVQLIDCQCSYCIGGFYITYKNQRTGFIPYDSTANVLKYQLMQLSSIEKVIVTSLKETYVCSSSGSVVQVIFQLPQGNQPAMTISSSNGLQTSILAVRTDGESSILTSALSVQGTKEYVSCSNRGICLNNTGICNCFEEFESSNGLGLPGDRGDCGYRKEIYELYRQTSDIVVNTTCPYLLNSVCSGHGSCIEPTGVCTCDSGYSGPSCANMTCPYSRRWFGDIGYNHSIYEECGGVGECDGNTGQCFNCGGNWAYYNGTGCEYLTCPSLSNGTLCSGNLNVCLTMYELGKLRYNWQKNYEPVYYNSTWDSHSIRGCWCERAISIDNQYTTNYKLYPNIFGEIILNVTNYFDNVTIVPNDYDSRFYRGPYAYSATDFKGYDCSIYGCPTGDNPLTINQVNEIQSLHFYYGTGYFTLTFRENTTYPIFCNETDLILKQRLEDLYTINTVSLTRLYNSTDYVCSNNSVLLVEFITEFGDLPLMTVDVTNYYPKSNIGNPIVITEYQKGTKEDIECSGQGICIESTGICNCVSNFMSSNGYINSHGERGDCTFKNPYFYANSQNL